MTTPNHLVQSIDFFSMSPVFGQERRCLTLFGAGNFFHLFKAEGGIISDPQSKLVNFHRIMNFLGLFKLEFNFQQRLFS